MPVPAPGDTRTDIPSSRMLKALTTGSAHLVLLMGPDGTVVEVAPSVTYLLGYEPEDLIGGSVLDLIPPEDRESSAGILAQDVTAAADGSVFTPDSAVPGDFRVLHADGHYMWFELLRTSFIGDPEINGLLVVGHRIDHRHVLTDAVSVLAYDSDGVEAMRQLIGYLDMVMADTRSALVASGGEVLWIHADDALDPLCEWSGPWDATGKPAS